MSRFLGHSPAASQFLDANYGAGFAVSLDDEFSDDHPTYMKRKKRPNWNCSSRGEGGDTRRF